ncbi:MAG: DUF2345 domain-containing protein, partial [Ralstonia mannitolilytica]
LGDYSSQHEALKTDADPQSTLTKAIEEWDAGANNHKDQPGQGGQPVLGAYAPAGIGLATPESLTSYAGQHIDTVSKLNQQQTAGQQYVVNAGTGISLFAHSGEWKGIAHQGQLVLQAQQKSITANARQDVVVTATDGSVLLNAKTGITLMSGNAGIRIADGKVEAFGPSLIHLHTGNFDVPGAQGIDGALPQFESGDTKRSFALVREIDGEPISSTAYTLTTADGSVVGKGVAANGVTPESTLQQIEHLQAAFKLPKLF